MCFWTGFLCQLYLHRQARVTSGDTLVVGFTKECILLACVVLLDKSYCKYFNDVVTK